MDKTFVDLRCDKGKDKWDFMEKTKDSSIKFPFKIREGQIKFPITADMLLCSKAWVQMRIEIRNKNKVNKDKIELAGIIEYIKKYNPYEEGRIRMAKIGSQLKLNLAKEGYNAEYFKLYALLRDEKTIKYETQPPKEEVGKYEGILMELAQG